MVGQFTFNKKPEPSFSPLSARTVSHGDEALTSLILCIFFNGERGGGGEWVEVEARVSFKGCRRGYLNIISLRTFLFYALMISEVLFIVFFLFFPLLSPSFFPPCLLSGNPRLVNNFCFCVSFFFFSLWFLSLFILSVLSLYNDYLFKIYIHIYFFIYIFSSAPSYGLNYKCPHPKKKKNVSFTRPMTALGLRIWIII